MKTAERVVMLLILFAILGGSYWIYHTVKSDRQEVRDAVARGDYEIRDDQEREIPLEEWKSIYPGTVKLLIGGVEVDASVADSMDERIQGLSNTPYLPGHVVKLFMFGSNGQHSIWMKDMNYPIDIIWATKEGVIVHIEESVSPDTFPESFRSPTPTWFVAETVAGFVEKNEIEVGDGLVLPNNS